MNEGGGEGGGGGEEEVPIDEALGAIGFSLDSNMQILKSTQIYFPDYTMTMETMKSEMKSKTKYRLASTMVGSIRSTSLQKPRSYQ